MKRSWYSISLVAGLLGLLVLLGCLQYYWLEKVGAAERERLHRRLDTDTRRFSEDFNREIQNAYFTFQLSDKGWQMKDWREFNERFDFWRSKTDYPTLIRDFYFVANSGDARLLHYNSEKREFETYLWSDELKNLRDKLVDGKNFDPVDRETFALVMPVHEEGRIFNRILIRTGNIPPPLEIPKKFGFLIIKLDTGVVRNQILPDLVKKYFSEIENPGYKIAVTEEGSETKVIFQTPNEDLTFADSTAKLFTLSPDNVNFFVNKELLSKIGEKRDVLYSEKFQTRDESADSSTAEKKNTVEVRLERDSKPRVRVFENQNAENTDGLWTLKVQHASGSLDRFVAATLRRNLAAGFGILTLLGLSVISIFLSAQRAKSLAQKQIDFVSAVSHEFRTPLAVIYSAAENLTDGIVRNQAQVPIYGALIKREGKKLSAMVEQILEFAGARSGKRKYDFRQTDLKAVIENALQECQPLIEEKNFIVEQKIADNLPTVRVDAGALSHSIQNLINNSIKYGNGNCWLKISAENGGEKVRIIIEDRGIGISKKDISHIFEPFYRSKTVVDEQIYGNGLGLSLVKQTIMAHRGKISVESEPGKGSRFTIHLPCVI